MVDRDAVDERPTSAEVEDLNVEVVADGLEDRVKPRNPLERQAEPSLDVEATDAADAPKKGWFKRLIG